MAHDVLLSLSIVLAASALVVFVLHKARLPSIAGFLLAGLSIGPSGIGLVHEAKAIEALAEVGVVLLLFAIGLEFSLNRLMQMKRAVLVGGGLQMALTATIGTLAALPNVSGNYKEAIFIGFLISLSSTAIVLKVLATRGELDSPQGRAMTGILIFQDLAVVPLMFLTPALSGAGIDGMELLIRVAKAIVMVALVLVAARWIVPSVLHQVVGTRSRELFIITVMVLCFGVALLADRFGLSLALGAFLAGLALADSEYAHQAAADVLPMKEAFMGIFFVSVGMLLDLDVVRDNFAVVAAASVLIISIKVFTGSYAALKSGSAPRPALSVGLGLAQVGEFSFILALAGREAGILDSQKYQVFLASSVVTMTAAPFMIGLAPRLWGLLKGKPYPHEPLDQEGHENTKSLKDHVIVIGYGVIGRNLTKVLKAASLPYIILELNNATVLDMRRQGEPIYFGDATSIEVLRHLGLARARMLVVTIPDPSAARAAVSLSRSENPALHIIVRSRFLAEVESLRALGADDVIPEEFETSIEIFTRVLDVYRFPPGVIDDMSEAIRKENYQALRGPDTSRKELFENCRWMPELEFDGVLVPEGSAASGKSIAELGVRKLTGATIVAVRRHTEVITLPDPLFEIQDADIIFLTGSREALDEAARFFKN